jgi:hypothetical protein
LAPQAAGPAAYIRAIISIIHGGIVEAGGQGDVMAGGIIGMTGGIIGM